MDARWVTVASPEQTDVEIILQPPEWGPEGDAESRAAQIGQAPGFVLASTDCHMDYEALAESGVQVIDPPMEMPWGISALFADLYGYAHNLLEPRDLYWQAAPGHDDRRGHTSCRHVCSLSAGRRSRSQNRGAGHLD